MHIQSTIVSDINNENPPDSLIMVKNKEGNFILVETMEELWEYYLKNRDEFDNFPKAELGKLARDEKGRPYWNFKDHNWDIYHDSVK